MQCFPKLVNNTAKVCCVGKPVLGLRKLIFHICFEPLVFVDTVKLFDKRLASFSLKAPQEICDPCFKFCLSDSFYLLKISLNAPSLVGFLIYGPGVTLFETSVADPPKFIQERKIQLTFRMIALTKKKSYALAGKCPFSGLPRHWLAKYFDPGNMSVNVSIGYLSNNVPALSIHRGNNVISYSPGGGRTFYCLIRHSKNFDVLLSVHFCIILVTDQLNAQILVSL